MSRKQKNDFYEYQSQHWFVWVLLIGINLVLISGMIWQVILGHTLGNKPISNTGIITTSAIIFIFSVISITSKLTTQINNDGIHISYFPFLFRPNYFAWNDIEQAYIRKNNTPLSFGKCKTGYGFFRHAEGGIRFTWTKKFFCMYGKYGLQLDLKNGKKVFIGTQIPEEIDKIIQEKIHKKS